MDNKDKTKLQRLCLANIPSPLIPMRGLADKTNVKSLYIKRDDLLGRILGGNKLRKLDYIIPQARNEKADSLITTGSFESNHVCLTVSAAKMLGMEAGVVLMGPEGHTLKTFNEKIQRELGATIRTVSFREGDLKSRSHLDERVAQQVKKLTKEFKAKGKQPFFVPPAGCCLEGTYAFVEAFEELDSQMQAEGHHSYDIVLAVGTGSTFAGLWCGTQRSQSDVKIYGISIARLNPRCRSETIKAAERVCSYLGLDIPKADELNIIDEYIGDGYAKPTVWSERAIKTALETEGLLLDHTYTGKAMGAMLMMIEKKQLGDRPVVFWHTGGVAGAIDSFGH
ncbi:MAG: pyridoxal-phosphate dependent enzyme [Sedimentisphaerales bacterium]|jgi:1-aminocyclopropane-1-carboxylate deaminase/D-cysteine desulfhydrase-like pyridoxal-dependent ACC family enzyme